MEETRREEIKKKLEPKHTPTSVPKAETGTSARITEGRLPVLQPPQLKPPMLRPKTPKIATQELKEGKEAEVPSLKASFQKKLTGEFKPKIPKVSVIEVSRSGELQIPIKELPKKEIKAFLKPPSTSVIGKPGVGASVPKLPEARIETPPMVPKPIKLSESETCTQKQSKPETYYKSFEEMPKEEIKVVEGQTMGTVQETSKSFGEETPLPPLFEELSSVAESDGGPVYIVLSKREGDSFAMSVAMLCREIYRIAKGGKPAPRWISKGLKDEIERELRAENMVFIVDDSKCELLPELGKIRSCRELVEKVDVEMVSDRLNESFSQNFGFVIFHVNEMWAGQFADLLKERVGKLVEIRAPNLSSQAKEILARACWGFVKGEGGTFDEVFGHCERKFSEELEKAKKDVELTHYVEWDKSAGSEHESMKAVVVDFLARELGAKDRREIVEMLERGKIKTEYELDGGRVDIYVPSQQRFVEVETFYGTGDPIDKLDNGTYGTLRKYLSKCRGAACRVDVVLLTGIQALLYARRLIKLAELYREKEGLEVNFYVPNLEERRLVPLEELFQLLRGAVGPSKRVLLTEDEVDKLWAEFSKALRERGMDPEKHRELFSMIDRSKSYEDNLCWMLTEIEVLKKATKLHEH